MGAGPAGGEDPNKKRKQVFINQELNRQFLLGQLAGLSAGTLLSMTRAPSSATTGTTLLRQG
jgi:hypothetical protein